MLFLSLTAVAIIAVLALRMRFFRGPLASPTLDPPRGIIDMHCHTAGIGTGNSGAWVSEELQRSWKFPLYLKVFGTSKTELMLKGDGQVLEVIADSIRESEHVDGAVILAMDAPYAENGLLDRPNTEVCVPNRFVGEALKAFPEFHFGASVHPNRRDALTETEWSKENGAVLMKWLPNIQRIDPADQRYIAYYEKLVELNLPLLTHVGDEDSFSMTNNALGDPKRLELPLKCGVRVIAAHVASSGENEGQCNVERLLEMMPHYPNLVADISTLTQFNRKKHLEKVLNDPRLDGRLMYGTDYPLTNTPMVSPLQYWLNLDWRRIVGLMSVSNSWDRDVKLKGALGVKREVFEKSREYLGL